MSDWFVNRGSQGNAVKESEMSETKPTDEQVKHLRESLSLHRVYHGGENIECFHEPVRVDYACLANALDERAKLLERNRQAAELFRRIQSGDFRFVYEDISRWLEEEGKNG